ncbi:sulfurtransferase TusA family protein [Methanosarcina hadiensis]|uniref:sulfurtransferase TusA family protein n=1 Tax=Methanosarcina hadiensis TaxID=3078083 RepID=UPI003977741A
MNLGEEELLFLRTFLYPYSGGRTLAELEVDVRGQTCPVPLVECRKAFKKASPGDLVIVKGTHPASKKEIPMACEAMGLEVLEIEDKKDGKEWEIKIRR